MKGLAFSGGIDSLITSRYLMSLKEEFDLVYVKVGSLYEDKELEFINKYFKGVQVLKGIKSFENNITGFIPFRNLNIALTMAIEGYTEIMFGFLRDEHFLDCSEKFCEDTSKLLSSIVEEGEVKIYSPVIEYSKVELVSLAKDLKVPEELLRESISCISLSKKQCGKCFGCYSKALAMYLNGYKIDFMESDPRKSELGKRDPLFR